MTDEDRQLLRTLRRLADACGEFCAGVIETTSHAKLSLFQAPSLPTWPNRSATEPGTLPSSSKATPYDQKRRNRTENSAGRLGVH